MVMIKLDIIKEDMKIAQEEEIFTRNDPCCDLHTLLCNHRFSHNAFLPWKIQNRSSKEKDGVSISTPLFIVLRNCNVLWTTITVKWPWPWWTSRRNSMLSHGKWSVTIVTNIVQNQHVVIVISVWQWSSPRPWSN